MMAGSYTFIFMCCSQDAGDAYELDHGIILDYTQPAKMVKDTSIRSFAILQPDKFKSRPISKSNIRLLYNGPLSGYNTANNLPTSRNWLRFDMKTKKSPEQVHEYVGRVLPFLQSEENVEAITACLQKLIQ
jgi:hypothetical protein